MDIQGVDYNKTAFVIGEDGHLIFTRIVDGKACSQRARVWCAIETQPPADKLVVLARSYATLKDNMSFRRRVSWLESGPSNVIARNLTLVEYEGHASSTTDAHGNTKRVRRQYKRTTERVIVRAQVATKTPMEVYGEYVDVDLDDALHDLKQIRNMKYAEKKKRKQANVGNSNNVADHIMETASMINEHDFVQIMIHSKGKPPSVILYTPDQLEHMLSCAS